MEKPSPEKGEKVEEIYIVQDLKEDMDDDPYACYDKLRFPKISYGDTPY